MQRVLRVLILACLSLKAATVPGNVSPGSCPPCDTSTCDDEGVVQQSCPDATLVSDPCGCCKVCGRMFGETCGGAYEYLGKCEFDLVCTAKPSAYLNGCNISGVCTSKQLLNYNTVKY